MVAAKLPRLVGGGRRRGGAGDRAAHGSAAPLHYNPDTVRDYRVANALQMEVVDRALDRFLGELKRRGLYDDALIVFTSDHGEMNGRRALVDKGVYLFPETLRVPLAIKMPKGKHRTVETPVCHLDIAPTLLELAGVEPEERLDGRSLLDALQSGGEPGSHDFLFECGWHTGVNFACGIQRLDHGNHHLYAYNLSSEVDELYDLKHVDGGNLARNREYSAAYREMVERLGAFLERDPRWIGYWHSFRVDRYHDLPKQRPGDAQMFRPV